MWIGPYTISNLLGITIQAIFIQNILLFTFLGMCSYLACSNSWKIANGLGLAVWITTTFAGILNWFVHYYITGEKSLRWLSHLGIKNADRLDLNFLEFLIFISVIAAFVQVLEIFIDATSPALYRALGMYLPLITVNCAILGACLFATARAYPFIPNLVYVSSCGFGWWLAIALIAVIREKIRYSHIPKNLEGMGITFIVTGLMAMAFMGFTGITLDQINTSSDISLFKKVSETSPFTLQNDPIQ